MHRRSFQNIDHDKLQRLIDIKASFLSGEISEEEARRQIKKSYIILRPEEFAYTEQILKDKGFADDLVHENMETLLRLLDGILVRTDLDLPQGHPLRTYQEENLAIRDALSQADRLLEKDFERSELREIYDKISQFNTHLSRKQNQLFPKLEEKGFDRPSKIMWSFDNQVKKAISTVNAQIASGRVDELRLAHQEARTAILDIIDKEETILYPTSLQLISEDEFVRMRKGDDEIGYCLIDNPPSFGKEEKTPTANNDFLQELAALVSKYQIPTTDGEVLDVKQGKLTLEQINLIFQHLPVDLSFVDEQELVKFYSDTTHRVFPRSPNVIGRNVMNCHPRESLDTVSEIIDSFRRGEQDRAEFWLEMGDQFIYILYIAVRNAKGEFKGVLEMMQEASHIRSLRGSRKLLQWDKGGSEGSGSSENNSNQKEDNMSNNLAFNKDTRIAEIVEKYPYIREFMPTISPVYSMLLDPAAFSTIGQVATLEMIAQRGELQLEDLIEKITAKIESEEK